CSNNSKSSEAKANMNIKIDGSSTVYPITEAIAEKYRAVNPKMNITIGISGTGGGFKKLDRNELDIADASRKIKPEELDPLTKKQIEVLEIPIAYDGLAVVVNTQNNWVDHLTVAELKTIWEPAAQGKIMSWKQVRSTFPDNKLSLMGPGTASGTFDYFTEAIVGKSGSSRGDYMPSEDDNVLVQGVKGEKNGLAFFGLAYVHENAKDLKLVPIDNGSGPVIPTAETVKNGTYKPLSRLLYVYVTSDAIKNPEVLAFLNFYLDTVKGIIADVGYVALNDDAYAAGKDFLKKFAEKHAAKK
ncbi:MAG TPA: PstS family phosphate ABC transporter substrate-binding protein, partial [Saprospiraceae bacterium]|nr:PstS family phosphate ABC transporter substrate-binding protein [Saprospiraceae bacterium]